ncbi:hypothetical protein [Thermococcus thermotolerans]|uniref:hypothetical protein n=1 Tax=Thermococcus thermotolerans TaxID=2969672 RepID=UPI00215731C5|nr:hypothetical protein [Thermococcus thermotolerans]
MKWWVLILLTVLALGGIFHTYSEEDVISYWSSITSFTAHETIKIGNQTFESHVSFTKPDKITRKDYINGSLVQKIVIENGIQKIITANGTFVLNATMEDINALDPFASILTNLESFNVTWEGDILLLKPKTEGMPTYEVELNGKLPERITIKQAGLAIVVEYKTIEVTK